VYVLLEYGENEHQITRVYHLSTIGAIIPRFGTKADEGWYKTLAVVWWCH